MKRLRFIGSAKVDLSAFPNAARNRAGHELFMVQVGREPDDWKQMSVVGSGAREIQQTSRADLELAKERYRIARELAQGAKHD